MIAVVVRGPTAAARGTRANVTAMIGAIVAEPSSLGYRREDALPPVHLLLPAELGGGRDTDVDPAAALQRQARGSESAPAMPGAEVN